MSLVLALLVVAGFILIADRAGLARHAREAGRGARTSLALVSDPSLSDEIKERRLQAEALRLFALLGRIVLATALAIGVPVAAVWALDAVGVGSLAETFGVLVRVDFLVAVSLVGSFGWWLARRAGGHRPPRTSR